MAFNELSCLDNHGVFRALLDGMARPGTVRTLPGAQLNQGVAATMHGLLQSILDPEVGIALAGDDPDNLMAEVRWQTGARDVALETADFLLVPGGASDGVIQRLKRGRLAFPDEGATVVYGVDRLGETGGSDAPMWTGPGIPGMVRPRLDGVSPQELEWLREINSEYPLGVDAIFTDRDGRILCLPRSTRIGGRHGVCGG